MMVFKITLQLFINRRRKLKFDWIKTRGFHKVADEVPATSLVQIRKVFRLKNVPIQEGHACIAINCPICKPKKASEFNVFVNKATGYFMCQSCRHTGTWDNLIQFLDSKKPEDFKKLKDSLCIEDDFTDKWNAVQSNSQSFVNISEEDCRDILSKYKLPSVSKGQMEQLDCHYDKSSSTLYFPLIGVGNRVSGFKSLSADPVITETTIPRMDAHGLIIYKEKKMKNDSTVVIVPSIEDLLALIAEKSANVVICLPYNLQHMPLQILPLMESYKKLILWFGNDAASWDSARHYSKKLNEKRCFFVRPTNQQPRPKIAALEGYNLKNIIAEAQPIWHKSITTFNTLREDVLSDLQNIDKVQGVKWTRFPTLNRVLKGHRRGEFTVLTGPTGCGKTTFMSEYSLDLAMQGVNTLWGSFEIRNARLARTMLQQMAGVPLDDNIQSFDTFADEFEKLAIYFMTFHGQQSIDVVMEAVEHATYVHDIAHVIIDNVQFMMGMSEQSKHVDRYWRQDMIVSQFRSFATKSNCHVTLVIHPRKERVEEELTTASIFGGAKASQEADNVLIIQDKRLISVRGKKYLQIAKNRYSGDLGIMNLEFDRNSLSYQQKKKQKTTDTSKESDENINN
ncbi:twinkle protein, mitochondrial [Cotesia glomerata]|uniref:twinkle protein, mitochondrial n=1 Tax=Cotesia glomerata TaxID=32391 RepID=UPI001D00FD11|nr:twinkle protein, mitochondrial [Cotesia glomerata]